MSRKHRYYRGLNDAEENMAKESEAIGRQLSDDDPKKYAEWESDKSFTERGGKTSQSEYTKAFHEKYDTRRNPKVRRKAGPSPFWWEEYKWAKDYEGKLWANETKKIDGLSGLTSIRIERGAWDFSNDDWNNNVRMVTFYGSHGGLRSVMIMPDNTKKVDFAEKGIATFKEDARFKVMANTIENEMLFDDYDKIVSTLGDDINADQQMDDWMMVRNPSKEDFSNMTSQEIQGKAIPGWKILKSSDWSDQQGTGHYFMERKYDFENFERVEEYVDLLNKAITELDHHPEIAYEYNAVVVKTWSHDIESIDERDYLLAETANAIYLGFDNYTVKEVNNTATPYQSTAIKSAHTQGNTHYQGEKYQDNPKVRRKAGVSNQWWEDAVWRKGSEGYQYYNMFAKMPTIGFSTSIEMTVYYGVDEKRINATVRHSFENENGEAAMQRKYFLHAMDAETAAKHKNSRPPNVWISQSLENRGSPVLVAKGGEDDWTSAWEFDGDSLAGFTFEEIDSQVMSLLAGLSYNDATKIWKYLASWDIERKTKIRIETNPKVRRRVDSKKDWISVMEEAIKEDITGDEFGKEFILAPPFMGEGSVCFMLRLYSDANLTIAFIPIGEAEWRIETPSLISINNVVKIANQMNAKASMASSRKKIDGKDGDMSASEFDKGMREVFDRLNIPELKMNPKKDDKKKFVAEVSKKTGIKKNILAKVYDKGIAAWGSGHRPGTNPVQWAKARVYAFTEKGGPVFNKKGGKGPDHSLAVEAGLVKAEKNPKVRRKAVSTAEDWWLGYNWKIKPRDRNITTEERLTGVSTEATKNADTTIDAITFSEQDYSKRRYDGKMTISSKRIFTGPIGLSPMSHKIIWHLNDPSYGPGWVETWKGNHNNQSQAVNQEFREEAEDFFNRFDIKDYEKVRQQAANAYFMPAYVKQNPKVRRAPASSTGSFPNWFDVDKVKPLGFWWKKVDVMTDGEIVYRLQAQFLFDTPDPHKTMQIGIHATGNNGPGQNEVKVYLSRTNYDFETIDARVNWPGRKNLSWSKRDIEYIKKNNQKDLTDSNPNGKHWQGLAQYLTAAEKSTLLEYAITQAEKPENDGFVWMPKQTRNPKVRRQASPIIPLKEIDWKIQTLKQGNRKNMLQYRTFTVGATITDSWRNSKIEIKIEAGNFIRYITLKRGKEMLKTQKYAGMRVSIGNAKEINDKIENFSDAKSFTEKLSNVLQEHGLYNNRNFGVGYDVDDRWKREPDIGNMVYVNGLSQGLRNMNWNSEPNIWFYHTDTRQAGKEDLDLITEQIRQKVSNEQMFAMTRNPKVRRKAATAAVMPDSWDWVPSKMRALVNGAKSIEESEDPYSKYYGGINIDGKENNLWFEVTQPGYDNEIHDYVVAHLPNGIRKKQWIDLVGSKLDSEHWLAKVKRPGLFYNGRQLEEWRPLNEVDGREKITEIRMVSPKRNPKVRRKSADVSDIQWDWLPPALKQIFDRSNDKEFTYDSKIDMVWFDKEGLNIVARNFKDKYYGRYGEHSIELAQGGKMSLAKWKPILGDDFSKYWTLRRNWKKIRPRTPYWDLDDLGGGTQITAMMMKPNIATKGH